MSLSDFPCKFPCTFSFQFQNSHCSPPPPFKRSFQMFISEVPFKFFISTICCLLSFVVCVFVCLLVCCFLFIVVCCLLLLFGVCCFSFFVFSLFRLLLLFVVCCLSFPLEDYLRIYAPFSYPDLAIQIFDTICLLGGGGGGWGEGGGDQAISIFGTPEFTYFDLWYSII